jgi:hypothetical protein
MIMIVINIIASSVMAHPKLKKLVLICDLLLALAALPPPPRPAAAAAAGWGRAVVKPADQLLY